MRQFDGNDRARRIPQELAGTGITAQAPHGPKQAAGQHGRRSEHAASAGRNDGARPGPRSRGKQHEIRGTHGRLVGQQNERRARGTRQRVDPGHEGTRKTLTPLPVHHDPRGDPGQLGPHACGVCPEDDDAAGGLACERDARRAPQQ